MVGRLSQGWAAFCWQVKASSFDEDLPHANFRCAGDYAAETATHKAIDVARQTSTSDQRLADVVIGSDTVRCPFHMLLMQPPYDLYTLY
jgi:predicted house-cleaning NTP pyrophosphatase (Maf/HAM1 superfamily)